MAPWAERRAIGRDGADFSRAVRTGQHARRGSAAAAKAQHPVHHGRRHRRHAAEHLPSRPDGRRDAQHRSHRQRSHQLKGEMKMRKVMILAAAALAFTSLNARAQTDLKAYADANGYLDVEKLTCAQLAGTWQEDADKLMV